ncbi:MULTISPECIES: ParB/RepB/Spo0J family partition protein [unclassified Yoonia]|uniref:ParB/RepB/Spo0J family partition protein n=1 Tax=unclassified Yoonia TaxID=2629118 RepID=UPI002AFEDD7D|nr:MULTISPECIES: ParB/RepB/Spo0J family partition protein [unclassified Yoonia]
MNKTHNTIFADLLKHLDVLEKPVTGTKPQHFLNTATATPAPRQTGGTRLVDPATCVMWGGHNRVYDLLNAENCADLIDGIKAQGQQEFPAVVRRLRPAGQGTDAPEFEVICGARRHFAVSWLRAHDHPQLDFLIEERDLTDEAAFRLADIENRDREDISDFERARDYARAVDVYYDGRQRLMAERLQVSPGFLSRFLQLARLETEVVAAFASIREIKEGHVRQLRPLLSNLKTRGNVLSEAKAIAGQGLPAAEVLTRLKAAGRAALPRKAQPTFFSHPRGNVRLKKKGNLIALEFSATLADVALRSAVEAYLASRKTA